MLNRSANECFNNSCFEIATFINYANECIFGEFRESFETSFVEFRYSDEQVVFFSLLYL